jgi:AraC family transcriptional regulator, transcriptional activator of pobA
MLMAGQDKIYSMDLLYDGAPVPFVIKTMEEIDEQLGGIADTPHRHNYYTVIWPVTATGKHIIDFREYPILPNHLFFVSPEQVHQIITDPQPTGFVILFTPEFLEKNSIREDFISNLKLFRNSDDTPPLPLTEMMIPILRMFTERMMEEFRSGTDMRFEAIGAYLKLFLIECNGHCSIFPGDNTQTIEVGKNLVRSFREAVEKHFRTRHQVKDYAGELFVSPNYLNDVIRSSMDVTAKEFIQNRIILEAKRMATFTAKSSKEIGYDLGFDDPAHFSKFFKSVTKQSVQEFRNMVGK